MGMFCKKIKDSCKEGIYCMSTEQEKDDDSVQELDPSAPSLSIRLYLIYDRETLISFMVFLMFK